MRTAGLPFAFARLPAGLSGLSWCLPDTHGRQEASRFTESPRIVIGSLPPRRQAREVATAPAPRCGRSRNRPDKHRGTGICRTPLRLAGHNRKCGMRIFPGCVSSPYGHWATGVPTAILELTCNLVSGI